MNSFALAEIPAGYDCFLVCNNDLCQKSFQNVLAHFEQHELYAVWGVHYCSHYVQIRVTVLYVNPTTKVLSLSELMHLVTPDLAPVRLFGNINLGAVVNEAVVSRVDPRRGVYFRLPDKLKAFTSVCSVHCFEVFWPFCICEPNDLFVSRFYARHHSSVHPFVRLSVRSSHGWISQKRCKLGSPNLHCRLPGKL